MHDQFIEPQKRFADLIITRGGENNVAIDVLASMIETKLQKGREMRMRASSRSGTYSFRIASRCIALKSSINEVPSNSRAGLKKPPT